MSSKQDHSTNLKRRHFLMFLGASAGTMALGSLSPVGQSQTGSRLGIQSASAAPAHGLRFTPLKGVMPLPSAGLSAEAQITEYSTYTVVDDMVLPEGYTYDVLASWGDRVGDSRFGYNNDYLSLVETDVAVVTDVETETVAGFLTINFEYISALPWSQTFETVIGQSLPFEAVKAAVEASGELGLNAYALADDDPVKAQIKAICYEAMVDLGIGVISVQQGSDGVWVRTYSSRDRRVTGVSGLDDGRYLSATGPAVAIFNKTTGQGYIDALGDRIMGTFNNCGGGTTPWGTVLSAEENFQTFVPESVHADGTSMNPEAKPFSIGDGGLSGLGNVFGLPGNKYGWIVEIDPANPDDYGTKHTWLGRYRHEAVGIRVETGKPIAFYSGCDRRGGHLYKFVSSEIVTEPADKANSRLFESGMLYAAKFNADGTGEWIPLKADTLINPELPSVHVGGIIPLPNPDRTVGGIVTVEDDGAIASFKEQFETLDDLYSGSEEEVQGAILVDAHFAANAAGATCTARPEDTMVSANGSLFITFTSGSPGSDGGPDSRIFQGPNGEVPYEYGWIMRLDEVANDPSALLFTWEMFATGGEPHQGGLGFSSPDNLDIDGNGNLWMVNDISTDKNNQAVPSRVDEAGEPVSQSSLRGLFGNNSIWFMPTSGDNAGETYLFGYGPMECETTGPFFASDGKTLFLSVQHPGEYGGVRQGMASETRLFAMKTTDGQEFMQTRDVPIGSNWPSKEINAPAKPSVITIRRLDGESLS